MVEYFGDEADLAKDKNVAMQVDVIGFNRGAAQARDFANRLMVGVKQNRITKDYWYGYKDKSQKDQCQKVNFRFMGLWDTVLSTNSSRGYALAIPAQFAYVAQAVALNEYRSSNVLNFTERNPLFEKNHWGGFPLESITGSANPNNNTRIEMGFIGAHSDIGGGYSTSDNQLSLVALNWMVRQAQSAGVTMKALPDIAMSNPVLHDQSNTMLLGDPRKSGQRNPVGATTLPIAEDRTVNGACNPAAPGGPCRGGSTTQRQMQFNNGSLTNADTHEKMINYTARNPNDVTTVLPLAQTTGTVNMAEYIGWLRGHGYKFYGDK